MEAVERDPREVVAQIFTSAGWTAGDKFEWEAGAFNSPNMLAVGGVDPTGTARSRAVRTDLVTDALWLIEHARQQANPFTTEATLDPVALQSEEVENPGDESNGETGEETGGDSSIGATGGFDHQSDDGGSAEALADGAGELVYAELDAETVPLEPIEAEFTEGEDLGSELLDTILEGGDPWALPSPEPEDFAPDEIIPPETQSGAFIFGDNLDQLRTAAIGRVIRYANALMPHWAIEDDARLAYLRNFAMGVSEKRWDDDPALSAELNALETTIRRINEIKNARDTKVEFLEGASREEIIDFAVEANWP